MDALKISVVVACVLSLVGCGKSVPSCSDSSAKDLVLQIFNEKFGNLGAYSRIDASIEDIRVTDKNDKTGSYACEAKINYKFPNGGGYSDVANYTTELTSDGKVYVKAGFH